MKFAGDWDELQKKYVSLRQSRTKLIKRCLMFLEWSSNIVSIANLMEYSENISEKSCVPWNYINLVVYLCRYMARTMSSAPMLKSILLTTSKVILWIFLELAREILENQKLLNHFNLTLHSWWEKVGEITSHQTRLLN